jgi:hypothetical protein
MESNMAMHNPNTGIISFEGQDKIATIGKKSYISSWRIVQVDCCVVQAAACDVLILRDTLVQDHEVMTMKMDGVLARNIDAGDFRKWASFVRPLHALAARKDCELDPLVGIEFRSGDFSIIATVRDNDMNMMIYVRMIKNESYRRLYI